MISILQELRSTYLWISYLNFPETKKSGEFLVGEPIGSSDKGSYEYDLHSVKSIMVQGNSSGLWKEIFFRKLAHWNIPKQLCS